MEGLSGMGRGSLGSPIPGGVQEMCGHGDEGCGLGCSRSSWWLDSVILETLSSPDKSVVLSFFI